MRYFLKTSFFLFLIGIIFVWAFLLSSKLTLYNTIPANTLVVEGWMPDYGLETAYEEFQNGEYDQILITGSMFGDYVTLYVNSYLIFYPHDSIKSNDDLQELVFDLQAESTLGKGDSARFVFWINNEKVTNHYTIDHKGTYQIGWEGRMSDLDSVMVQFTNDKVSSEGDRNLRIKKMTMNGWNFILENADMYVDRGRPFGGSARWNITASSFAEMAAHYFTDKGIAKEKIIPVSNHYPQKRRTYGNALALRDFLLIDEGMDVKGINVVSMDYHSRRTAMTYGKVLRDVTDVGIISSENLQLQTYPARKYRYIMRETMALGYYMVFVLPWV